eukprot:1502623-Rhodomonas_salina.1
MRASSLESSRDLQAICTETDKISVSSLEADDRPLSASFEMADFESLQLDDPDMGFDTVVPRRRASATSRRRSSAAEAKRHSLELDLGLPETGVAPHSESPKELCGAQRKHSGEEHIEIGPAEIRLPASPSARVVAGREWDFTFDRNASAATTTGGDALSRLNSESSAASRASSGGATRASSGTCNNRRSSSSVVHERTASSSTIDEERQHELAAERRTAEAEAAEASFLMPQHAGPTVGGRRGSARPFRELLCSLLDEDGSSSASTASTHDGARDVGVDPARRLRRARYNRFIGQLLMQELAASVQEI